MNSFGCDNESKEVATWNSQERVCRVHLQLVSPHEIEHRPQVMEMVVLIMTFWLQYHRHSTPLSFVDDHRRLCSLHVGRLHLHSLSWTALSYTPNGVHNDVYFSSSGYILIWLYPKKSSIKDILSKPYVLSIMTSVIGNENSSLGQAVLRSRKSMQTLIFLFFIAQRQY